MGNRPRTHTSSPHTYCLNGHIQIDDYVKVESREDKGNYRASKIRFIGDTEGDDWQCVGQFVEVK